MKQPRLPIQRLMFWVAVVAVNLGVVRALFTTRRIDLLLGGVLTWLVLQFGATRAVRDRGRGRPYWLGFTAGGAAAVLAVLACRSFPRSAFGAIWRGYLNFVIDPIYSPPLLNALERSLGGDYAELALALYDTAAEFVPILLSALAGGLLARGLRRRSARKPLAATASVTSPRPSSSPASP